MATLFCKRLPVRGERPVLGSLSIGDGNAPRIAVATVPSALTLLPAEGSGVPLRFLFDSPPVCVSQCREGVASGEFAVLCEDGAVWRCSAADGQGASKKPKPAKPRKDAAPAAFTVEGDTRVPARSDAGACTRVARAHRGSTILLSAASGAALVAAPLPNGAVTILSFPAGSCIVPATAHESPALTHIPVVGGAGLTPLCFVLRASAEGDGATAEQYAGCGEGAGGGVLEVEERLFEELFGECTQGEWALDPPTK